MGQQLFAACGFQCFGFGTMWASAGYLGACLLPFCTPLHPTGHKSTLLHSTLLGTPLLYTRHSTIHTPVSTLSALYNPLHSYTPLVYTLRALPTPATHPSVVVSGLRADEAGRCVIAVGASCSLCYRHDVRTGLTSGIVALWARISSLSAASTYLPSKPVGLVRGYVCCVGNGWFLVPLCPLPPPFPCTCAASPPSDDHTYGQRCQLLPLVMTMVT